MPVNVPTSDELATVIERLIVLESRVTALEGAEPPPPPPPPPPVDLPEPNRDEYLVTDHDRIYNFGQNPTVWSVKSGNWSTPATWNTGVVPGPGDVVSITGTTEVVCGTNSTVSVIVVQSDAALMLDGARIVVSEILVHRHGKLMAIQGEVVFQGDYHPLDTAQHGIGLICLGELDICGETITSFIRLAQHALSGESILHLASSVVGWQPGDEVILPDTHQLNWNERGQYFGSHYVPQNETRRIAAVNGQAITLDKPLAFDHLGYIEKDSTVSILPHVGLLTRNIVFRSGNPDGIRGHVMCTGDATVNICHAEFRDLGRTTNEPLSETNRKGRYALHLHHVHGHVHDGHHDGDYLFEVDGVSVVNPQKWGVVVHNSHYGRVANSVVYHANGAGIVTEDGNESFNVIEGNFVCHVRGTGARDNDGRDGVGYWFHGPNNIVRNNVAANVYSGTYSYGYSITPVRLGNITYPVAKGSSETVTVNSNAITIPEFSGNEVYACTNGITCWWLGSIEESWIPGAVAGTLKDCKVWHCHGWGYFGYAAQGLTIDGWWVRGDTMHIDVGNRAECAVFFSDYFNKNFKALNCDIRGYATGIEPPVSSVGETLIEGCTLDNRVDISLTNSWAVSGGQGAQPRSTLIKDCRTTSIRKAYLVRDAANGIMLNSCRVVNHQRVTGDTFNVYCTEQQADYIVPMTGANAGGGHPFIGAPEAGLTNTQCLAKYGVCVNGEICPVNHATVPGVTGLIVRGS